LQPAHSGGQNVHATGQAACLSYVFISTLNTYQKRRYNRTTPACDAYLFFFVGSFLRLVLATSRSCLVLMDFAICRDAPLSEDLERLPRLAANAAPAAICCFLDFAGIS
jgi:hypothetical protein